METFYLSRRRLYKKRPNQPRGIKENNQGQYCPVCLPFTVPVVAGEGEEKGEGAEVAAPATAESRRGVNDGEGEGEGLELAAAPPRPVSPLPGTS